MAEVTLPLDGLRVLDFTHAAAGPFAAQSLGDMGAAVIKVERPGRGDGARHMGRPMHGPTDSDYFLGLNRNKRSVSIDLQDARGAEIARRLATTCDVVIENFRPGVMDRLGIGFEDLRGLRPGLIYCSISAFGDTGPWASEAANDLIMQSMSGIMSMTGNESGPVKVGTPICDYVAGLFATIGVLGAVTRRDDHPSGQHIKVPMITASLAVMSNYIPWVVSTGQRVPRLGTGHAQLVPYQGFACADGKHVMVGAFTNAFWQRLCVAIGEATLVDDPRYKTNSDRVRNRDTLVPHLEKVFLTRERDAWLEILRETDIPVSPILDLDEVVQMDFVEAAGSIYEVGDDERRVHMARFPVSSPQWGQRDDTVAPRLGEHTLEVLTETLGCSEEEVRAWQELGVVDCV